MSPQKKKKMHKTQRTKLETARFEIQKGEDTPTHPVSTNGNYPSVNRKDYQKKNNFPKRGDILENAALKNLNFYQWTGDFAQANILSHK